MIMETELIPFDLPKNNSSNIKVLGVGGGGSNAVNYMFRQGIEGVNFFVCNTDAQALDISPVPNKIQLGINLTKGLGAGNIPEVGRKAAIEDIDRIKETLESSTDMIFITAGMGGGTGTGAAPVIAQAAKELGILTVGIITIPFSFEGRKRRQQAEEGIKLLAKNVDTILIISNDKLRELYGNLNVAEAFAKADNVLATGAKGIAEIITRTGEVNVDFADVSTVMTNSGVAIMGSGTAEGENRALNAIETALSSPLLNDNQIKGAKNILLNITNGTEKFLLDEMMEITDYIVNEAGSSVEIIWGLGTDESMGAKINVTLVATGFDTGNKLYEIDSNPAPKKNVLQLDDKVNNTVVEWDGPFHTKTEESEKIELKKTQKTSENTNHPDEKEGKSATLISDNDIEEFKRKIAQHNTGTYTSVREKNMPLTDEEREQRVKERDERLKQMNTNIKTADGLDDYEKQPAYVRRKVMLSPVPASNESQISRYMLSESMEKKVQIKSNNSFLHDNVD